MKLVLMTPPISGFCIPTKCYPLHFVCACVCGGKSYSDESKDCQYLKIWRSCTKGIVIFPVGTNTQVYPVCVLAEPIIFPHFPYFFLKSSLNYFYWSFFSPSCNHFFLYLSSSVQLFQLFLWTIILLLCTTLYFSFHYFTPLFSDSYHTILV